MSDLKPVVDITIVADTKGGAKVSIAGGDPNSLTSLAVPKDADALAIHNDQVLKINTEYAQMKNLIMTNQPYKLLFDLQQTMKKIKDSCSNYKNNRLSGMWRGGSSMETKLAELKGLIGVAKNQAINVPDPAKTATQTVLNSFEPNLLTDKIDTTIQDFAAAATTATTAAATTAKNIDDALLFIDQVMADAMKTAKGAASGMTLKSAAITAIELAIRAATDAAAAAAAAAGAAAGADAGADADAAAKTASATAKTASDAAKTASATASGAVTKWAGQDPANAKAATDAAAAKAAADAAAANDKPKWEEVGTLWTAVKTSIGSIKGGKRRRTSKRARKGKHGTRRHYY